MKVMSFSQFLEAVKVPNLSSGSGRRRYAMPQISMDDINKFIAWGVEDGHFAQPMKTQMDTKMLVPTQSEFNQEKIEGMIDQGTYKNKRVMVSNDNRVLDGHHTWLAAHADAGVVDVIKFNADSDKMLDAMKSFPGSFTKKLNEAAA